MLKLVVDTCVWLDLAKDYRAIAMVEALADLINGGDVQLLVPAVVMDEFDRRKVTLPEESRKGLQSHFRFIRDTIRRLGDEAEKISALQAIDELAHKVDVTGDVITPAFDAVSGLLASAPIISIAEAHKVRASERAMAGNAPYHRGKNAIGDALIIEAFAEVVRSLDDADTAAFVTHNVHDFSEANGDRRKPHPDLAALFQLGRSTFWNSLADCLKDVAPELVEERDFEHFWAMEPRRLAEIVEAEQLLFRQVWYNRHWNLRSQIESGEHHVVPSDQYSRSPYRADQTLDTVWAQALEAAKRTEDEIGLENLGPWDDFEWGMINGKLSALRWVLGDEWDMLDT